MKYLLLSITLLGCTPAHYVKPNGTNAAFQKDRLECKFYLQTHGDRIAWPGLMNDCLGTKGWVRENR